MKKLFLVIICAVIIGVFIGFNYMLWERERNVSRINGLETSNAANDAKNTALSRQVKDLEEENSSLTDKVSEEEKQNNDLQEQNRGLQDQLNQAQNQIKVMGDTIYALKTDVDTSKIEDPVKKWVDALNKGDYEAAYRIYGRDMNNSQASIGIDAFKSYFNDVLKSIKLKSMKLYSAGDNITDRADIVLETVLDIRLADNAGDAATIFSDGINERYFTMAYDGENKTWMISAFSKYP